MFKVWKPHLFKSQFNDFLLKLELVFCFKIWFNFLFILFSFLCIFCSKYLFILFILVVSDADIEQFQRTRRNISSADMIHGTFAVTHLHHIVSMIVKCPLKLKSVKTTSIRAPFINFTPLRGVPCFIRHSEKDPLVKNCSPMIVSSSYCGKENRKAEPS